MNLYQQAMVSVRNAEQKMRDLHLSGVSAWVPGEPFGLFRNSLGWHNGTIRFRHERRSPYEFEYEPHAWRVLWENSWFKALPQYAMTVIDLLPELLSRVTEMACDSHGTGKVDQALADMASRVVAAARAVDDSERGAA